MSKEPILRLRTRAIRSICDGKHKKAAILYCDIGKRYLKEFYRLHHTGEYEAVGEALFYLNKSLHLGSHEAPALIRSIKSNENFDQEKITRTAIDYQKQENDYLLFLSQSGHTEELQHVILDIFASSDPATRDKCLVNVTDEEGNTVLHLAAKYGHIEVVKILALLDRKLLTTPNHAMKLPVALAEEDSETKILLHTLENSTINAATSARTPAQLMPQS